MKKDRIILYFLFLSIIALIFSIALLIFLYYSSHKEIEKRVFEETTKESEIEEESESEYEYLGDDGNDGFEEFMRENEGKPLDLEGIKSSKKTLINLAIEYNESIPFYVGSNDSSMSKGYVITADGVDNYKLKDLAHGMSSKTYIKWIFRNTFSQVSDDFLDLVSFYNKSEKISLKDIKVGDIGLYSNKYDVVNHFGVCVGFYENEPIFSHISSSPTKKFPAGTNKLSFLVSSNKGYLGDSSPVDLKYFFRPNLIYDTENDSIDYDKYDLSNEKFIVEKNKKIYKNIGNLVEELNYLIYNRDYNNIYNLFDSYRLKKEAKNDNIYYFVRYMNTKNKDDLYRKLILKNIVYDESLYDDFVILDTVYAKKLEKDNEEIYDLNEENAELCIFVYLSEDKEISDILFKDMTFNSYIQ